MTSNPPAIKLSDTVSGYLLVNSAARYLSASHCCGYKKKGFVGETLLLVLYLSPCLFFLCENFNICRSNEAGNATCWRSPTFFTEFIIVCLTIALLMGNVTNRRIALRRTVYQILFNHKIYPGGGNLQYLFRFDCFQLNQIEQS